MELKPLSEELLSYKGDGGTLEVWATSDKEFKKLTFHIGIERELVDFTPKEFSQLVWQFSTLKYRLLMEKLKHNNILSKVKKKINKKQAKDIILNSLYPSKVHSIEAQETLDHWLVKVLFDPGAGEAITKEYLVHNKNGEIIENMTFLEN